MGDTTSFRRSLGTIVLDRASTVLTSALHAARSIGTQGLNHGKSVGKPVGVGRSALAAPRIGGATRTHSEPPC